jgi:CRP-like cAMP-binding protein
MANAAGGIELSACVTCAHREAGFCAAAFRSASPETPAHAGGKKVVALGPGRQILIRGNPSDHVFVLCAGWAFRYIQLSDGSRQIQKFLLPGDLFSSISIFEEAPHFSVKALTEVQFHGFARSEVRERCLADRDLLTAIAQSCVADGRDSAQLIAVLGRCSAEKRIAHLFLHLIQRIAARQVIRELRYPFPLRHQHIADAVGLTPVHVSRVLSHFRERGIVTVSEGVLEVADAPALERIGLL